MTAFHGVVDRARVSAGEWVAVHGCGGVGLSVVQIATALGANVIAVDIDPAKLEFAERVDGRVLHPTGKLTLRTLSHVEHRLNLLSARRSAGPGLRDRAPAPSMRPSAWLLGCTLPGVVEATALNTYPIC